MNYWLFKSEPGCYSWQDLEAAPGQTTSWDGVRNYQARNFMKAMKKGDLGFFYHSGADPSIVGVVEVVREAYPALSRKELSAHAALAGMELMRRGSRLSVQPVSAEAFEYIMHLANEKK